MKKLFFIVVVCYAFTFTPIYKQYSPGYFKKIKKYVHSLFKFEDKPSSDAASPFRHTTFEKASGLNDVEHAADKVTDEHNYGNVPSTIGTSSGSGRKY